MTTEITFDALSSTDFEQLAYDMLYAMGFKDLNWRKGTGYESSPADQGRDLECTHINKGPDGSIELERWFVECKHYKKGVPPDALSAALAWAQAERPTRLLFVISNFLSNPAKQYIETYEKNNRPSFRIVVWELPRLQEILGVHTQILRKYGLLGEFPLLSILHPSHIRYLKMPPLNSLDYLLGLLDDFTPSERNECISWTMHKVVNPRFRDPPPNYKGTIGELMIDKVDYPTFKAKCRDLCRQVVPGFLVSAIVNDTLQFLLHLGDPTTTGRVIQNIDETLGKFRRQIVAGDPKADVLQSCIKILEQNRQTAPDNAKKHYELYRIFCERVVGPLFDEKIEIKLPKGF